MSGSTFVPRVAGVLATRVTQFALGLALTYTLAHLLGPAGRGVSYVVLLIPGTLFAIATFGFPSSITFFSGRGRSLPSLRRAALLLSGTASVWLIAAALIALPFLQTNLLDTVPSGLVYLVLIAMPFQLAGSLMGSVLYGRQVIRAFNLISLAQAAATLLLVLVLVGLLDLSVTGAVLGYAVASISACLAIYRELRRAERVLADPTAPSASIREIVAYGLRLYPGVVTSFFNYRADVFLLNWLLAPTVALGKAGQVGLYSIAVSLAEMAFYVPDSISSILFPRVASGLRADADRTVPTIARLTVTITFVCALALVPAALIGVHLLLPEYAGSLPALVAILPGVVALGLSKVLAGYLTGLGQARPTVIASSTALVLNVVFNLLLIPPWGIVGAAIASLISYGVHAGLMLRASCRASGAPLRAFLVPTRADAQLLLGGIRAMAGRLQRPSRSRSR